MRQGTTPPHTFTLPVPAAAVTAALITYAQDDRILFEKSLADCTQDENKLKLTLTQEETFQFDADHLGQVQARILTGGKVLSSDIISFGIDPSLSKVVLK